MGRNPSEGCINQKKGDIADHQMFAILKIMPNSMNAVSMAKVFYYMLDAYEMTNKRKVAEVIAVLAGAVSAKDFKISEEGEDNDD